MTIRSGIDVALGVVGRLGVLGKGKLADDDAGLRYRSGEPGLELKNECGLILLERSALTVGSCV